MCSEGNSKLKTKIDKVKAEKKALRERLRRSEARVRQLEGHIAKRESLKDVKEKPTDFESRETETI